MGFVGEPIPSVVVAVAAVVDVALDVEAVVVVVVVVEDGLGMDDTWFSVALNLEWCRQTPYEWV